MILFDEDWSSISLIDGGCSISCLLSTNCNSICSGLGLAPPDNST